MKRRRFLLILLAAPLACCKRDADAPPPPPRDATDTATAYFCGMSVNEHAGPKAQIFVRDLADPFWFSSVRDAFAFIMLPETPKAVTAIYVNDMASAKDWEQPEPGRGSTRTRRFT